MTFFLQVSGISNAYTVKSLPGAYLYIPVPLVDGECLEEGDLDGEEGAEGVAKLGTSTGGSGFPTAKRSLSDPEIHFAAPLQNFLDSCGGPTTANNNSTYSIILRVNPKLELNGKCP